MPLQEISFVLFKIGTIIWFGWFQLLLLVGFVFWFGFFFLLAKEN